jgi:parvulin-like peptidyl-prolyl isomerase
VVEYQDELVRFQTAVGRELTSEDEERVLDDLISQLLLAQAAAENGYKMTETVVQDRLDQLIDGMGGKAVFDDWLVSNNYVEDSFRGALARSISAAWMRDQIAASVPEAMDQVHAQQILVFDAQEANLILGRIQSGADFSALAFEYDPTARGDLGWFPRGYLLEPRVEEAAFELQPGQHSEVIETQTGYHIVFIIERDPARALDPDARLALQITALQEWLESRKAESDIQIR